MLDYRTSIKALLFGLAVALTVSTSSADMVVIDSYHRAYTCSTAARTFLSAQTSTADATSYTFSNVSIGNPPCAGNIRVIVALGGCNAITSNASNAPTMTLDGASMTSLLSDFISTNPSSYWHMADNSLHTTANFVFTVNGAGADVTCERAVVMLWSVITTTISTVDNQVDSIPTGDFDFTNIAVTLNGAEIVGVIAQSATACDLIDPTFNGTETVTEDVNGTLETALSYRGGSFVADSTATADDYANISCGTETDGFAAVASYEPPV